jgi:hypothetical protein
MSNKRVITTFRLDEDLLEGLREVQERDGVLVSEQVRRGIKLWLHERGIRIAVEPARIKARRRPIGAGRQREKRRKEH